MPVTDESAGKEIKKDLSIDQIDNRSLVITGWDGFLGTG